MATVKKNLGKIPCPCCGDTVAIYQSQTDKLSFNCQNPNCEATGYAGAHTGAAKQWLSKLPKEVASKVLEEAKNEEKPEQKPEQKPQPKASVFGTLGL